MCEREYFDVVGSKRNALQSSVRDNASVGSGTLSDFECVLRWMATSAYTVRLRNECIRSVDEIYVVVC
jgi:hypothetical protein